MQRYIDTSIHREVIPLCISFGMSTVLYYLDGAAFGTKRHHFRCVIVFWLADYLVLSKRTFSVLIWGSEKVRLSPGFL